MLTIRHLTKTYKGGKRAVDDLSLTVENGDIYGFIGHNGAGKSTTIRSVVGVLDFEEGTIEIDGHDVKRDPLSCKQVTAYIPDNPDPVSYTHLDVYKRQGQRGLFPQGAFLACRKGDYAALAAGR